MPIEDLTPRQLSIYEFIRDKIQNRGYGPTVREIGDHFNISSPNGVMCHLKALEKKQLIEREEGKSRAIKLTGEALAEERGFPLRGQVAAGVLHEAIDQDEHIDFTQMFQQNGVFALEVRGDSMIEAHIDSGDYVLVKSQAHAEKGQMVVAQTDEGEATLKYWHPEDGRIRLQPANSTMEPIYVKNAQVLGVIVGVVRQY